MTKNNNDNTGIEKCSLFETCPFLVQSQKEMLGLLEKLKGSYCLNNYRACARRVVAEALGQVAVPAQMMPHQNLWAEQVLADAGKGSLIYNNRRKDREKTSDDKIKTL